MASKEEIERALRWMYRQQYLNADVNAAVWTPENSENEQALGRRMEATSESWADSELFRAARYDTAAIIPCITSSHTNELSQVRPRKLTVHIDEITFHTAIPKNPSRVQSRPISPSKVHFLVPLQLMASPKAHGWGNIRYICRKSSMDREVYVCLLCKRLQWLLTAAV
jgi:hypothetical protein